VVPPVFEEVLVDELPVETVKGVPSNESASMK
jgi:hypothetical protein